MRGCVIRSSPQSAPRRVERGERLSVGRSQRDTSRFGAESWDRLCPSDRSDRHAPTAARRPPTADRLLFEIGRFARRKAVDTHRPCTACGC